MHKHDIRHLGKRRVNHHSTYHDTTVLRTPGVPHPDAAADTSSAQEAESPTSTTRAAVALTASSDTITSSSPVAPSASSSSRPQTSSAFPSLQVVFSSRSSASSSQASSSSRQSNTIASSEASSITSSIPNTASKFIPAILASVFVVLAAILLVFCLHRRRKLAKRRDALTSLAPSPYEVKDNSDQSFDEKAYPYSTHNEPQEILSYQQQQYEEPQSRSFFGSIRDTIRRKSTKNSFNPSQPPWQYIEKQRSQSPEIPKVPPMTQVPSASHDPFRDGFGPGAAQLATGLAATTMTSQSSQDSHSSLSHK